MTNQRTPIDLTEDEADTVITALYLYAKEAPAGPDRRRLLALADRFYAIGTPVYKP